MKKMKIKAILLSAVMLVGIMSALIGTTKVEAAGGYNADVALKYASEHWNDGQGLCAEFVSKCVQAGGISIRTEYITTNCYNAVSNATGVQGQVLKLNSGGYATKELDGDILSAGDVVIQWCNTHTYRPHILLCGGYDSSGYATFYAHNSAKNNERFRFNVTYSSEAPCNRNCDIGARVLHISTGDVSTNINSANPGAPYPIPSGNLRNGSRGDSVKWVQKFLNDVRGAGLAVDGIYGSGTANAVKIFQQQNGLTADGIVGAQTVNRMLSIWRAKLEAAKPKPLDIGNNVCGLIFRQDAWKPIRNTGSNVELWGEKGTGDYYWLFKRQGDGSYEIQSMYDGKVLDAWAIGTESGTNVVADKANGGDNQRWYIYSNGTKGLRFVPKHAQNLSLDVAFAGSADGTNIQIHNSNDSVAQRFEIYRVEYKKLTGISIASDYRKNMYINDRQTLKYSLSEVGTTCNMVTWSSSDSSVADVDSNGQVTAKKAGKVTISCISAYDNSIKDSVSITVQKKSEPTTEKITTERPTTEATTEKVTTEKVTTEKTTEVTTEKATTEKTTEVTTEKATTEKTTEVATEKATTEKATETAVEIPDGRDEEDNIINVALPKEEGTELTIVKGKCIVEVQSDDVDNPTAVYVQSTNKKAKNIVVPNTVTYAGVTYKITAIEDFAFEGNRKITKVTIGDNVTDIGEEAFAGCKKLTSITIGKSVTAIGKKAFYNCKKLKKIVIKSKKVKKIGKNAFRNIHAKAVIKVPKNKLKDYKKLMKKAGMR